MAEENLGLDLASQTGQEDIVEAINSLRNLLSRLSDLLTLGSKTVTQNGTYDPDDDSLDGYSSLVVNVPNTYAASDEGKVLSNGELVAQSSQTVTQNGTYDTTLKDEVIVDIPSVSQEKWPFIEEASNPSLYIRPAGYDNIIVFNNNYAKEKASWIGYLKKITNSDIGKDLSEFLENAQLLLPESLEYYGNTYGNSALISDTNLILLADCSDGTNTTVTLSDSINNYKAIILNGIYQKQKNSQYNTSMLYINPELNTTYWAGMKDRNSSYNCKVVFTSDNEATLSGNKQVIIYGMP